MYYILITLQEHKVYVFYYKGGGKYEKQDDDYLDSKFGNKLLYF